MLQTNDSCLIGDVNKIQIANDTIYLQSKQEILIFSPQGKWLSSFANQGQGPKEYLTISSLRIKNSNIYILDQTGRKIISYDLHGNYINSWKLDNHYVDFFILDDSYFVLASQNFNNSGYQFMFLNSETGQIDAKFGKYNFISTTWHYSCIPFAGLENKSLIVNIPYSYTNYKLNIENYSPFITFDFNTDDKIPQGNDEEIDIDKMWDMTRPKLGNTLKLFMGVEHLSYFTSTDDAYYLSFILTSIRGGSHKNIVKFDKKFNQIGNILLGFEYLSDFPYLEEYNYIWDGKIVSVRYAETLLQTDKDLGLSHWKSKGLTEDSNPVVLIWTLK